MNSCLNECVNFSSLTTFPCVQCTNTSRDIVSKTLRFIKLHTLMADLVRPSSGRPLYYAREFSFTKLQVEYVSKYRILYLYSPGMHTRSGFC